MYPEAFLFLDRRLYSGAQSAILVTSESKRRMAMILEVNGVELYYEVMGQGKPLILVHGNGEDHRIFTEAAQILKEYFTCYLVDSRSHGQSGKVKRLHYRDMAGDYMAFIEKLGLEDVTYFGFSDGGILGLMIAAAGDQVKTLVVSGANTRPDTVAAGARRMIQLLHFFTRKDMFRLMLQEPDLTAEELGRIRARTFVLAGEKDLVLRSDTDFIAASIPGAVEKILPGETHGSHIVHSTKIAEILLELVG